MKMATLIAMALSFSVASAFATANPTLASNHQHHVSLGHANTDKKEAQKA